MRQKALVIAYAVHETGRREVIGLDVGEAETEAFWREFLQVLRARGLDGVRLCVSDAHEGLKNAIAQVLGAPVAALHRPLPARHARPLSPRASSRWSPPPSAGSSPPTRGQEARERLAEVVERLEPVAPKVAQLLEDAEDDLLAFYALPAPSTGPSCAPRTRWSASTARSAAAPTSSASSPTTPP